MIRRHGPSFSHPPDCFGCHVLTVQLSPQPFQAHYNYAVGAYVTNERDFQDRLKRLSDLQSARTGIAASYEPIHPSDLKATPPPEAPPSHLPRLVAKDDDGRPLHEPVDSDPTDPAHRELRDKLRRDQSERAVHEQMTKDLIEDE